MLPYIAKEPYVFGQNVEIDQLILNHPRSNRLLHLLNNPSLAQEITEDDEPNCHGTTMWIFNKFFRPFPDFLPKGEFDRLLEVYKFKKINTLPFIPSTDIAVIFPYSEEFAHSAVYLGQLNTKPVMFEQFGTGDFFDIAFVDSIPFQPLYKESKVMEII